MQTLEREQTFTPSTFPRLKRWTVTELEAVYQQGQGRCELIEGIVYDKMGSGGQHSKLICMLTVLLLRLYRPEQIRGQLPIRIQGGLGIYNAPEPDIAITLKGASEYDDNPHAQDVLLVVEVSDSSLSFDLSTKAKLYSSAGIAEYWVVDVEGERLLVHREPTPEGYRSLRVLHGEEIATPLSCSASLKVAELFAKSSANR